MVKLTEDRVREIVREELILSYKGGNTKIPLSGREIEVLGLVAAGRGSKEIASMLGLSQQTIKNQVATVLTKLGAFNRPHAVALAMSRGWLF